MGPSAFLMLGWGLVRSQARRIVRRRGGDERALRHYASDRIRALTTEDRAAIAGASRCIACGRCDEGAADRAPSDWILARLRDLTDHDVADAPHATEDAWRALEAVCPAGVPFRAIASR